MMSPAPERAGRPWWDSVSANELRSRAAGMHQKDLEALLADIRGRLAVVVSQIETSQDNPDREWRKRALRARAFMVEKKRIVAAAVQSGNLRRQSVKEERKAELIAQAREHLAEKRPKAALEIVLDLLEGKDHEDYEADDV